MKGSGLAAICACLSQSVRMHVCDVCDVRDVNVCLCVCERGDTHIVSWVSHILYIVCYAACYFKIDEEHQTDYEQGTVCLCRLTSQFSREVLQASLTPSFLFYFCLLFVCLKKMNPDCTTLAGRV